MQGWIDGSLRTAFSTAKRENKYHSQGCNGTMNLQLLVSQAYRSDFLLLLLAIHFMVMIRLDPELFLRLN